MFVLYVFLDRRSFIDPICCNFCMVLSMFLGWFGQFLFSLRDINSTLGLLPPRRHVMWRYSVGVESSGSGLKIIVRVYFASEFFCCYAILTSPKKGETAVYGYIPAMF